MKRVAVFGNAGGGKSTLARELAAITGLPLHVIDMMQFREGGAEVPQDEFQRQHDEILEKPGWIIDGYGGYTCLLSRFEAADTLIHVDLPLALHFYWVTKRLFKGLFAAPEGWPKGSPVVSSSISSYKVLLPCHRQLTPKCRSLIGGIAGRKTIYRLRSKGDIQRFVASIRQGRCPTEP